MKKLFVNNQQLPLIIEPEGTANSKSELLQWVRNNFNQFSADLLKHGAVLFRGFEILEPQDFEELAIAVDPRLEQSYYGTSPRNVVPGTRYVYTASELPGYYPIMQHCEMSYVKHPPVNIFFYCHSAPDYGGESPICNFRKVYAELHPKIREEFESKGVVTVRNYSGSEKNSILNLFELKKWTEIFNTTNKAEVEKQCRDEGIAFEWRDENQLRLLHHTPAAVVHPVTGEKAWFNHLQVFHPHGADTEYTYIHARQKRVKTFVWKYFLRALVRIKSMKAEPIEQSMNVLFGDFSPVPDSYVEHVQEVIWKNLVILPWQKNAVMVLDNYSTAHGRLPYEGQRNVLVSWST